MDLEVTGTESTASAPESTESAASTPATTETPGVQTPAASPEQAAAQTAYTPNYKYMHLGKEHEFDEWIRPVIKDAETEKKLREMYQKANGVDHWKQNLERERNEHGESKKIVEKYNSLDKELKMLGGFLAKGDLTSLFKNINLSEQDVFKWAQKRIHEMGLPAEQQQALRQAEMERERLYALEQQAQDMRSQLEMQQTQARSYELDTTLAKPDVQTFASSFDAQAQKEGAFKQAVIEYGAFHARMRGVDLTVEQAVKGAMDHYGRFFKPQAPAPQAQKEIPAVIPHVAGKASSPVRKKARSIKDLIELEKTL